MSIRCRLRIKVTYHTLTVGRRKRGHTKHAQLIPSGNIFRRPNTESLLYFEQVDDRSTVGGRDAADDAPPRTLTVAELFDEDRLEVMSCKLADYDPARLAAEAGGAGEWLEENPNPSLSPKAVRQAFLFGGRDGARTADSF